MDSSNLAIVMAPSIMPLPAAASAQRLEHHVALVKVFSDYWFKNATLQTIDITKMFTITFIHFRYSSKTRST